MDGVRGGFVKYIEKLSDNQIKELANYDVEVFNLDDFRENYLYDFREKMLNYFGNQYAIDYLLSDI